MSWLKKGPVLGTLGACFLLWAFIFFFFDPILKRALIAAGQAAAGAKVDIGSLRSKWLQGTLEISRVAVADREQPMTNVGEFSRAAFRLDLSAALRGKCVVREAALEGLRAGTPRAASGALRNPPPPSTLSLAIQRQIAPAKAAALAKAGETRSNAAAEVDAAKLSSLKKLDEAKAKSAEIERRWQGKTAEGEAIEREAREIGEQLKALGAGGDLLRKISESQRAQERIKALIARVDAQRAEAQKDLSEARSLLREAEELRKQDLNGLLSAMGLPTLDSADLARRLLGAQTAARLSTVLGWMRLAREKAAAQKAANPPPPPRRRGLDIEFARAHSYPRFLLEGAKITGTLDGAAGGALDLKGLLNGVTSNPKLYGKPATLSLSGASASGPAATLHGRLDQQIDPVGVSLDFEGSGFSLAGTSLGDGEVGGAIKDGSAKLKGHLSSLGDEWKGEVFVEATRVVFEPKVALAGPAGALISDAFKSLTGFNLRVGISGREGDLKLAFSSDVADVVAAAMKKAASGQIAAQKKLLEAKLSAAYGNRFKDAQAHNAGLAEKLLGPLDAQKGALNKQLQDALGKAVGNKPLRLDKLFK